MEGADHPEPQVRHDAGDSATAIRVMLVDDSIVARSILERIIEADGDFIVCASVPSANDALSALNVAPPDIIVLDIEMPGMSGLTALPLLIEQAPRAKIIILSANCADDGPAALEALALGAADTLLKPGRGIFAGRFGQTLVARLRALSGEPEAGTIPNVPPPRAHDRAQQASIAPRAIGAIGIGASTGGIVAINQFLGALPREVTCPIFITQHLPDTFIPFFAAQLQRVTSRTVLVADDASLVQPNHVYIAPGDGHIELTRSGSKVRICINRNAAPSGAMPSVDPMLTSLADAFGQTACCVMLSGMGRDGIDGARCIRARSGLVLAQNVESSVVWGMPGAVAREGMAAQVCDPATLARTVGSVITADRAHG